MEITKASEPTPVHAGLPTELPLMTLPPSTILITPLDLEENPTVRTKLRLYLILTALYVTYPALLVFGENSPS
jgi:hypothetical protein